MVAGGGRSGWAQGREQGHSARAGQTVKPPRAGEDRQGPHASARRNAGWMLQDQPEGSRAQKGGRTAGCFGEGAGPAGTVGARGQLPAIAALTPDQTSPKVQG